MKSAIFLSCLLAGTTLTLNTPSESLRSKKSTGFKTISSSRSTSKPVGAVRIIIDKSDYELKVYDDKGWYATYPVVFGNNTLADKCMEGDKCTPEGSFKIASKRRHEKWSHYMGFDYPTKESLAKINELKRKGMIPKNASPGGGVGIHGTWPNDDFMIDRYSNWTNGCVSMKNSDVTDLYSYVPVGTPVTIKK
jgi:lipoprotein-anchoring transpeptidase ErfK/SrfK